MKRSTLSISICILLAQVGCRSKIESFDARGKSKSISLDNNSDGQRLVFQSRSTIVFKISRKQLGKASSISLTNYSTDSTLIENLELTQEARLQVHSGYSIETKPQSVGDETALIVKIFPSFPQFTDIFLYGENQIGLELMTQNGTNFIQKEIVLRDFNAFGLGSNIRPPNQARPLLDGWFGGIIRPVVKSTNGDKILTAGFFHSVNY